jgi:tetratricopeptide (TPR) repeat protein
MDVELQMQLPSPQLLEKLSLGYQNFLANILWIKTIAYYGGAIEKADYNYMQRLLSAIIQLNPNAEHAYYMAATAIPWNTNSTQLSKPIVERAIRQFPHDWRWPYYRGFNAYWFDHDYKEAGRLFSQAALIDNTPQIVTNLALRMQAESGQLDTALSFLQHLIEDERDSNLNKQLLKQRNILLTEKILRRIDDWLATLQHRFNDVRDLQQLRQNGYTIPLKLADGGKIIVNDDGAIVSSDSNKRFKVFASPKRSRLNLEHNQQ